MFKHLLMPTDGSETSTRAINAGIVFAKEIGAKVTGIHVMSEFHVITYQTEMLEDTKDKFMTESIAQAKKYLAEFETAAKAAGVQFDTIFVASDHPFEEIIKAAQTKQCDLITMASHGRKGLKGLLLGSETQKVLTHSPIPVLVFR